MDPVLLNDWHPVAIAAKVERPEAVMLLDNELVLWRDCNGSLHAWDNRCPHRGTRLSIGNVVNDTLACAYHGWRFGLDGHCSFIPAQPASPIPPLARVKAYAVTERYGLVWVCMGEPKRDVLPFPEYAHDHLRKVICGPYDVATSGPRIVENFLDMAHFGFIHDGILGDQEHTTVQDYKVQSINVEGDGENVPGIIATACFAWQPQTNSLSHQGSNVEYTYRVVRPLTAILTKMPEIQQGFHEAISLHVQPMTEETSRVWIILAMTNFEQEEETLRAFQDRIFLQDKPILENQVPKRLPMQGEIFIRCDSMSRAYRAYLRDAGLQYGLQYGTQPTVQ